MNDKFVVFLMELAVDFVEGGTQNVREGAVWDNYPIPMIILVCVKLVIMYPIT